MSTINLCIGLPAYGGKVAMQQARMWLALGATLANSLERFKPNVIQLVDTCGIDVARNKLTATALELDCDWLLMIDADTWHDDAADILRMISDADRWPRWVGAVAAAVPRRAPYDEHLMVYRNIDGERRPMYWPDDTFGIRRDLRLGAELQPIDSAATAMMAVNLNFLRHHQIQPPWFRFEWREGGTKPVLSEDHYFCQSITAAGGLILADGRFRPCHVQRPEVIGGASRGDRS